MQLKLNQNPARKIAADDVYFTNNLASLLTAKSSRRNQGKTEAGEGRLSAGGLHGILQEKRGAFPKTRPSPVNEGCPRSSTPTPPECCERSGSQQPDRSCPLACRCRH